MPADPQALASQFFSDCEREGIPPSSGALTAWLWFTCPADMRTEVRALIERDTRFIRGGSLVSHECTRCGHVWYPRSPDRPRICPKCKSPYWDKARRG